MTEPTLFERIIAREIPGDIVYEDDLVVAFRDIDPQAPTHILIVPRKPIASVERIEPEDEAAVGRLLVAARKIADQEGLTEGYRCLINAGEHGGQEVPHLHLHLVGGRPLGKMLAPSA